VQAFPNNIFTSVIKAVSDLFLKVRPPVHSLQAVSTRPSWTLPLTADEACWQLSGLCTTSGTAPAHSCACLPLLVSHTHTGLLYKHPKPLNSWSVDWGPIPSLLLQPRTA